MATMLLKTAVIFQQFKHKLLFHDVGFTEVSEMHAIAFITVDETDMKTFRDALKPHRGVLA